MGASIETEKQSYQSLYEDFDAPLMRGLRDEAYGEDLGQHSWVTAEDLRRDVSRLKLCMGHICRRSVILLLAGWISAVHAQSAVQPVWKVGDKWSFKENTSPPPAESTWTRVVRETLPDGTFRVQTQTDELLIFDGETNSLDPRGPEYSWKRFSFPFSVGKEWSYKRSTGVPPNNGYENASWKVVAYESVTVPAGTFECFRVEGIVWQTFNSGLYGQAVSHQDVTYWYCPSVKWFARMKIHRYNDGRQTESESILTSFNGEG